MNKQFDITDGYETDPLINNKLFIKILDNEHFFPKYYASPLADKGILEKYPKIRNALSKLAGRINVDEMAQLIGDCQKKLDELDNKSLRASKQAQGIVGDIAKEFLIKKGILTS